MAHLEVQMTIADSLSNSESKHSPRMSRKGMMHQKNRKKKRPKPRKTKG